MQLDLLGYLKAEFARDIALDQVKENNQEWFGLALMTLTMMHLQGEVTGEDIRNHLTQLVGRPKSANAWGSLIMRAIRQKIIEPTGHYVAMKDEKSHARKTALYRMVRK